MSRPINKFLLYSAYAHIGFFAVAGFLILRSEAAPAPIRVTLLAPEIILDTSMEPGEVMDLPQPAAERAPESANILSKWNSTAHGPERGKKPLSGQDAIPREKAPSPAPSKEKWKTEILPSTPNPPPLNVASLPPDTRKNVRPDDNPVNVFSDNESEKKLETERARLYQKGKRNDEERRTAVSATITDNPGQPRTDSEKPVGPESAKGASLSDYASTASKDVVDMGDEAVVSFNTRAFQYADYFNGIRAAVDRVWEYPEEAILGGWSGRVKVVFTLRNDGQLLDIRILKSAGHKELDDSAQAALLAGGPYSPFPPGLDKRKLHVVAEFSYQPSFHSLH